MSKRKEAANTDVVVVGGDLDVGGIIKNAEVGTVLRTMQVRKLRAYIHDKGSKQSIYDQLIKSGAIVEQPAQTIESPPAGE